MSPERRAARPPGSRGQGLVTRRAPGLPFAQPPPAVKRHPGIHGPGARRDPAPTKHLPPSRPTAPLQGCRALAPAPTIGTHHETAARSPPAVRRYQFLLRRSLLASQRSPARTLGTRQFHASGSRRPATNRSRLLPMRVLRPALPARGVSAVRPNESQGSAPPLETDT